MSECEQVGHETQIDFFLQVLIQVGGRQHKLITSKIPNTKKLDTIKAFK